MVTIIGVVKLIWPMEVVGKGFKIVNFVVEDEPNNNCLKLKAVQQVALSAKSLKVGDKVSVNFEVVGRMFLSKTTGQQDCFNTLNVVSIMPLSFGGELPLAQDVGLPEPIQEYDDDLPF